ncbi:MAG TPA: hypothetical protein VNY35_06330 [Solirubrobacteraceae bacterium]|nr:hypothetical protein [Solirubrobacteraceae bacterium]
MGLLEDAIREHLELKRLRGADPAEVAREQREALDAPTSEAPSELVEDHAAVGEDGTNTAGHAPEAEPPAGEGHAGDVPQAPVTDELSHAAQETAELDMESVMAEEPAMGDELAPRERADIADAEGDPPALAADEESLEWEVPARAHDAEAEFGLQDGQNADEVAEMAGEQDVPEGAGDVGRGGGAETQERAPGQGRFSL